MAVMPIKEIGDPVLRTKAKKVEKVDDNTRNLIKNLIDTLRENEGLGLAANQIGILQQVAVVEVEEDLIKLINPEILGKEGKEIGEEGCLSVPGKQGPVTRAKEITLRYQDEYGEHIKKTFSDLTARVIQHEIDHLHGELFVDKIVDISPNIKQGEKARELE